MIFTSYFLSFYVVLYYTQFEVMVEAILKKKTEPPMPNTAITHVSGKPRAVDNMHVFVVCQIDVVNKQFVSPLSWNNP